MNNKNNKKLLGAGLLSAIAASLCCITPVLAFLSGATGFASTFSWIEPARPFLIGISGIILGLAWYQKLKPRKTEEPQCFCDEKEKTSFLQTRTFLGIVTAAAILMMAFPSYGSMFYPDNRTKTGIVPSERVETVEFKTTGMTCAGCEGHIRYGVSQLNGVVGVTVDYKQEKTVVQFDRDKTSIEKIREAIDRTGYKAEEQK